MRENAVVLDTDIGDDIDDTWALALLLRSPELDVKLVTTTCGKAEYRAKIIARLLTVAGRTEFPSAWEKADTTARQPAAMGQEVQTIGLSRRGSSDGAGAIIDLVERSKEPVTVIAIGPLHTLAAALDRRASIAGKASLVGMHGSVRKGYDGKPPSAEYNVKGQRPRGTEGPLRALAANLHHAAGYLRHGQSLRQAFRNAEGEPRSARPGGGRKLPYLEESKTADEIHASSVLFDTAAV